MTGALEDVTRHITALGGTSTRARELTLDQAWALVETYGNDGTLPRLSFPKQRDRKAFLNSHQIDTVDYVKVLDFNNDGKITKSSRDPIAAQNVGPGLDVRFIVLLVRITRLLRKRFGASQIFHLGFQSAHRDAHGDGRALDFVGAAGSFEGTAYTMNVFSHWKLQPVEMPVAFGPHKKGDRLADWPTTFHDTNYRLDVLNNQHLEVKPWFTLGANELTLAEQLFAAVYDLAAAEGRDVGDGTGPTVIGKDSREILHPDYFKVSIEPAMDGRNDHFQHIHLQLGTRSDPMVSAQRWLRPVKLPGR
jgi:hypothetical protein